MHLICSLWANFAVRNVCITLWNLLLLTYYKCETSLSEYCCIHLLVIKRLVKLRIEKIPFSNCCMFIWQGDTMRHRFSNEGISSIHRKHADKSKDSLKANCRKYLGISLGIKVSFIKLGREVNKFIKKKTQRSLLLYISWKKILSFIISYRFYLRTGQVFLLL